MLTFSGGTEGILQKVSHLKIEVIAVFYCLGKVSIVWANSVVLSIAERRCRID